MANKKLVEWFREAQSRGFSSRQCYEHLVKQGHDPKDVEKAMKAASEEPEKGDSRRSTILITTGIIILLLIGGAMAFMTQSDDKQSEDETTGEEKGPEKDPAEQDNLTEKDKASPGCEALPEKIQNCEPYSCKAEHPLTAGKIGREIIGQEGEDCHFIQIIPGQGEMDCNLSPGMKDAFAEYFRDTLDPSVNQDMRNYTIDGKEVNNLIQEAMREDECSFKQDRSRPEGDGELKIEWQDFSRTRGDFEDEIWRKNITIINGQTERVVLDMKGRGKDIAWGWGSKKALGPGETRTVNFDISLYLDDEPAFDKKNITINAYECNNLSNDIKEKLCVSEYGIDRPTPWEIISRRKEEGDPIEPTTKETRYFDYYDTEAPPERISKEEFLND
ncbi:MAG: hypothetical protein ACQEP1_01490 [Nanobdellota archaeon]